MPKKHEKMILDSIHLYVRSNNDLHVVMANFEYFFSNKKRCPEDSTLTSHRFLSTLLHFTLDKNVYKGSASESGFFGFLEAAAAPTFGALALHFRLGQLFRRRICETGFSYGVSCVIGPIGQ